MNAADFLIAELERDAEQLTDGSKLRARIEQIKSGGFINADDRASLRAISAALRIPAQGVGVRDAAKAVVDCFGVGYGTNYETFIAAITPLIYDLRDALTASSPSPEREALERAARVAIDMIAGTMRETAAEIRPESDMAADALIGVAEALEERRDLMASDICRALIPPLPEQPAQGER